MSERRDWKATAEALRLHSSDIRIEDFEELCEAVADLCDAEAERQAGLPPPEFWPQHHRDIKEPKP